MKRLVAFYIAGALLLALVVDKYRWIWSHTTGRPYTYIFRQWSHQHRHLAFFIALGILTADGVASITVTVHNVAVGAGLIFLSNLLWLLMGHLYWDTRGDYIKHTEKGSEHDL